MVLCLPSHLSEFLNLLTVGNREFGTYFLLCFFYDIGGMGPQAIEKLQMSRGGSKMKLSPELVLLSNVFFLNRI